MSIKEIIATEKKNENKIYLYKEGIFWRAYEVSLYLLTTHIKPLKVLAKRYKNIGQEVVYGGFPDSVVMEVIRLLLRVLKDLSQIDIKAFAGLNVKIEEISKQFTGWEKYAKA